MGSAAVREATSEVGGKFGPFSHFISPVVWLAKGTVTVTSKGKLLSIGGSSVAKEIFKWQTAWKTWLQFNPAHGSLLRMRLLVGWKTKRLEDCV